ncbi:MAG: hypothetical protein K0B10_07000 [Vicingaceae bacterium]|nr:hypothetical protein [Vicingaceae bacterium]
MKYNFLLFFILIQCFANAQQPDDALKIKKLNTTYLATLLSEKINEIRKKENLTTLKIDAKLTEIAFDQTESNLKLGKPETTQSNKKKATLSDRIIFFEAMHGYAAENATKIPLELKVKIEDEKNRRSLKTYQELVDFIAASWLKDKANRNNILTPNYFTIGTGISVDTKGKNIYINQIYANEPFILPKGVAPIKDDYKIEPYNKTKCNDLERTYSYLPELMSDNIFFRNGEIFFYFHDLALLKNVLKDNKDGISLDIINKEQFACGSGNKIYPSKIHAGIMLPPVYKAQLFSKNLLEKDNQIEVSLGPIPNFVDTNTTEFNLLIIKDNCLCNTIIYNSLGGENLKSLGLSLILDTLSISKQADSVTSVLKFTIPFDKNKSIYKKEDIKPFLDSLNLKKYDLKKIEVFAYSSIEGRMKENIKLQEKRAKSIIDAIQNYNLKNVTTAISTEENWDGFFESIKGSPYEKDFAKLSKDEIRKIVNSDTLNYNLEPYLADQRNAKIVLTVEKIYMDDELIKILPLRYKEAVRKKEYDKALLYQSVIFSNIENKKIDKEILNETKIPFLKETIQLNNNLIAFRWHFATEKNNPVPIAIGSYRDSLNNYLLRDVITQLRIAPTNAYLLYNKTTLELLLWTEKYERIKDPKFLLKDIKSLYNLGIENWRISQLLLNYHIIAADYYYETMKFEDRDRSLNEVKKILLQSQLNRDQAYQIAQYFIFQMRLNWTIELMKPWAEKPTIDEEFLFTFLSAAIYNKKLVPENEYLKFMEKAKTLNKERFCSLFGYPNMSFQLLKDVSVKNMYCQSCED